MTDLTDPAKRREAELQAQWDLEAEVFKIQNAAMKNRLLCPCGPEMCSTCGESTCINHWKAQNRLWGVSDEEAMKETSAVFSAATARKNGQKDSSEQNAGSTNYQESKMSDPRGGLASGKQNLFNREN
ncbi:MAG: hypothetical protein AB1403_10880 [Candidatus Riflebacteria bacterium]